MDAVSVRYRLIDDSATIRQLQEDQSGCGRRRRHQLTGLACVLPRLKVNVYRCRQANGRRRSLIGDEEGGDRCDGAIKDT